MREAASRGFWVASRVPYGFRKVYVQDGAKKRPTLEPDEDAARVVKSAFDMAEAGRGMLDIARALNDEGIASPAGKLWSKNGVHLLLRNEAYTGALVWGTNAKDKADPVRVEKAFPSIVSKAQFRRVKRLMRSRAPKRTHPRRVGSTYLLSGLVKCKECDRAFSGQEAKSGQFSYYVCQSIMKRGKEACDSPRINARRFEEMIVGNIRSNILTDGNIRALVKVVDERMDGVAGEQRKRLETIEDELEDVKRKLGRIWHLVETTDTDMADASDRIKEGFVPKVLFPGHFGNNRPFCSKSLRAEYRLDPKLVDRLNQHADVMTQNLDQHFIHLGHRSLRPDGAAELGLAHRKGRFHIRPLVVVRQELAPVEVVVVVHPLPQRVMLLLAVPGHRVCPEWDVGGGTHSLHRPQVLLANVRLVAAHFADLKTPRRGFNERGQVGRIGGLGFSDLNGSHDVGLDAAHQVGLHPFGFLALLAPLVVQPTVVDRRGEPTGIHGEVGFHRPERQRALLDQGLQQWGQFGVLQVAESACEGRGLIQQSLCLRVPEVGHCPPTGHCGVDLEAYTEQHIGEGQPRPSEGLRRLRNSIAKFTE